MRKVRITARILIAPAICFALGTVACTHTYNISVDPISEYPTKERIHLKVALLLPQELRDAKFERHGGGDTWVIPLGEAFYKNAAQVSEQLFSDVVIVSNGAEMAGVDAILIPTMQLAASTVRSRGQEQVTTVMFKWHLTDPDGNTVWVETIRGEGKSGGLPFANDGLKKRLQALNEDLFHKSFEAMASSLEIRDFAERRLANR
jgi:hypothetical protein